MRLQVFRLRELMSKFESQKQSSKKYNHTRFGENSWGYIETRGWICLGIAFLLLVGGFLNMIVSQTLVAEKGDCRADSDKRAAEQQADVIWESVECELLKPGSRSPVSNPFNPFQVLIVVKNR